MFTEDQRYNCGSKEFSEETPVVTEVPEVEDEVEEEEENETGADVPATDDETAVAAI